MLALILGTQRKRLEPNGNKGKERSMPVSMPMSVSVYVSVRLGLSCHSGTVDTVGGLTYATCT